MKPIYKYAASFAVGVILGRITKTPQVIRVAEEHDATDHEMKESLLQITRVMIAAMIEGAVVNGLSRQTLEERRLETVHSLADRYLKDSRVPEFARPLLPEFLDEMSDPRKILDSVSPRVMRLIGDASQALSQGIADRRPDPTVEDIFGEIGSFKKVLLAWEAERRPEAHTRTLKHVIGALAAAA
jgi:hypothetical protein